MSNKRIGVALYGSNGHQLGDWTDFADHADLVACGGGARGCNQSLDDLLSDPAVELVSLCSPLRSEQAADALRCLRAGRHVYAEKPCAFREEELDEILATVKSTGCQFREMAGTILQQPYAQMHRLISDGVIGEVVQILAQKSYPWRDSRPADERIDGGLSRQVGIYIMRYIEHIADQRIQAIDLRETLNGNPKESGRTPMAAQFQIQLANGGLALGICNYLNPLKKICWGYEFLRVFGTQGILETDPLTKELRLIAPNREPEIIPVSKPSGNYFLRFLQFLQGGQMPLSLESELQATRWVIRAKAGKSP